MSSVPQLKLPPPRKFSRLHLVIRLLLVLAVSGLTGGHGWPGGIVYFGLPAAAAILVSQHGRDRFLDEDASFVVRALRWLVGFYAYLGLLTDRFPTGGPEDVVELRIEPSGAPTPGSAVLRILTSIPAAIALWLLGVVAFVLWV